MESNLTQVSDSVGFEERLRTFTRVVTTKVPIAQTPKQLIWSLNKTKLYRYNPVLPEEKRYRVPLLLVFAIMNRPYILDLRPGHSFVEFMVARGYDVYLLDWGVPGIEDKNLKMDDYALEYLPRAVRKVKSTSGCEQFSLLGWCIGAVLTSIYAAVRQNDGLRNLLLLTAPLDFSKRSNITLARWCDEKYFDVEKILSAFGNMPAEMLYFGAKSLKPVDNYLASFMKLWDNLNNPKVVEAWQAMNTWVTDNIPMPGAAYRQLINELYRENALIKGHLRVRNQLVDLHKITASLLTIIAEDDCITPPCQSETIIELVSSADKEIYRVPGGHIGIMAGKNASQSTWPYIHRWLDARSK